MKVVMLIIGIALAIVFMINVHYGLKKLFDSYKPSRLLIPPKPKEAV